jgi:hypothetical protein
MKLRAAAVVVALISVAVLWKPSIFAISRDCIAVGALWGITNPLLKQYSSPLPAQPNSGLLFRLLPSWQACSFVGFVLLPNQFLSLLQFLLCYGVNQCGSLLFYATLGSAGTR